MNPFLISGYNNPDQFCDRRDETANLREALTNGRNTTLFSPRRMGKTGLIHHLFHTLKNANVNRIYIDISGTEDLNGLIVKFANAALKIESTKPNAILKRAVDLFGKIRPTLSLNELTGVPEISFRLDSDREKQSTLQEVFGFLDRQKTQQYIAIDEFQQINYFPEKNTEQLLRTYIQQLKNSHFVFSGSQRHLLLPMFNDAKRPFYQSTGFLALNKLGASDYREFILRHFNGNNQQIDENSVNFILDWTKSYTFYTQYFCNKLYSKKIPTIKDHHLKETIIEIFTERETLYYNLKKLLSPNQYKLLKAIAIEDVVNEPTGHVFLSKHTLGNASTVRKSLLTLIQKEVIYETLTQDKPEYQVYDVFLSRWIQWNNS